MQVQQHTHLPLRSRSGVATAVQKNAVQSKPVKSAEDVWTRTQATEFLKGGILYGYEKMVAKLLQAKDGLKDAPSVKVDTPVLLVHGYNGKPTQYDPLIEQLTRNEENGAPVYIKHGQTYADSACSEEFKPNADSKVFYMMHEKEASPEIIADDVKLATQRIEEATQVAEPDVVAHSLGGLGTRIFCDRGGKVGKLAMVGTPNQGSRAAMLTKAALKNGISWAMTLAGASAAAEAAFSWMVPVVNGNEKLEQLNERWPEQRENMQEAIVFAAKDFTTPNPIEESGPGDGLIEADHVSVGDVEVKFYEGKGRKSHFTLINDPDVNEGMREYFGWQVT